MKVNPLNLTIIKSLAVSAQCCLAIPKDGLLRVVFDIAVLCEFELRLGVTVVCFGAHREL